jgi:hypothetical protein
MQELHVVDEKEDKQGKSVFKVSLQDFRQSTIGQ